MAPAASKGGEVKPRRKRARKTRTAVVSDVSSSSSSSDSDSSDNEDAAKVSPAAKTGTKDDRMDVDSDSESDSDSSSSDSSSSKSEIDSDSDSVDSVSASRTSRQSEKGRERGKRTLQYSPPPQSRCEKYESSGEEEDDETTLIDHDQVTRTPIRSQRSTLIDDAEQKRQEAIARKREKAREGLGSGERMIVDDAKREEDFLAVWMRIMVDEFGEELDALRKKEPTLTSDTGGRMPLLIDALQAGSELFSRGDTSTTGQTQSVDVSDEVGLMLYGKSS